MPPTNSTQIRVRYCECDPMGVAHHASYIPWLEIGRTELLRASGQTYRDLEDQGLLLVIVKLEVRYRRPVRYDDIVEIRTNWSGGGRVKIEHAYSVAILETAGTPADHVAATATSTLGAIGRDGKIRELPSHLVWPLPPNAG